MMRIKKLTLSIMMITGLSVSVFSQDPRTESGADADADKEQTDTEPGSKSKREKDGKMFSFALDLKAYGGELVNYESYKMSTPLIGAAAGVSVNADITENMFFNVLSKSEGRKTFSPFPGTKLNFDQFRQYLRGRYGVSGKYGELELDVGYLLSLRPSWPDLYQPNPLNFGGTADPKFGAYLPTDRNSYQRFTPEINYTFTMIKDLEILAGTGFVRNIENTDPAFDPNVPTHITPSSYSGFFVNAEVKYKGIKHIEIEFTNRFESANYDTALARDALTGKTHYATTPNPKYKDTNNKSTLAVSLEFKKIKLEIKPFFAYDINTDSFQGYYSYTGLEPGIEIRQKLGAFRYALKISGDFQTFGPNSYDAAKTLDGKALFKNYLKGSLELTYRLNKHFELFAEGDMLMKTTNYPPYVPGVNPAKRNYDINFAFNNYSAHAGVSYKFR